MEDSVFISIVCFANRTKFKVKTHSDREFVVHTNDLKSAVLDHPQCMGLDMNAVADRLESLNIIIRQFGTNISVICRTHIPGNSERAS